MIVWYSIFRCRIHTIFKVFCIVFIWRCILWKINYTVDSHVKIDCLFKADFILQLQQLWCAAESILFWHLVGQHETHRKLEKVLFIETTNIVILRVIVRIENGVISKGSWKILLGNWNVTDKTRFCYCYTSFWRLKVAWSRMKGWWHTMPISWQRENLILTMGNDFCRIFFLRGAFRDRHHFTSCRIH